ncbi:MAG: hypothetical protein HY709_11075 [Candidatus Latescibacteria bacterium]|nr:hypothetical protein [Candidatus Latescibacterota bacterium]
MPIGEEHEAVHWDAFGGLSYADIVNQYNGVNGITVDIVDLNYDEWVKASDGSPLPVPLGPNSSGSTWYQRQEGFYVSKTLLSVDKLINIPATSIPM